MAIEVKVRCLGKMHKLVLGDNGQLCLCNHKIDKASMEEMEALETFGSERPRCLKILGMWRKIFNTKETDTLKELPADLMKYALVMREGYKGHRLLRRMGRKPKLDIQGKVHPKSEQYETTIQLELANELNSELNRRGIVTNPTIGINKHSWGESVTTEMSDIGAEGMTLNMPTNNSIYFFHPIGISVSFPRGFSAGLFADVVEMILYTLKWKHFLSKFRYVSDDVRSRVNRISQKIGIRNVQLSPGDKTHGCSINFSIRVGTTMAGAIAISELRKLVRRLERLRGDFEAKG